jgi:hypothetical protein
VRFCEFNLGQVELNENGYLHRQIVEPSWRCDKYT